MKSSPGLAGKLASSAGRYFIPFQAGLTSAVSPVRVREERPAKAAASSSLVNKIVRD